MGLNFRVFTTKSGHHVQKYEKIGEKQVNTMTPSKFLTKLWSV